MTHVGMGCMRLSTDADRDESRAVETLCAARDAGVTLFDTAAAYGLDDRDRHHNEALIARALGSALDDVTLVTKCGMRRPRGGWQPDGRRKTIMADAERSARALGRPPDLLLLHAPDPKTDFETSVRALAAAAKAGLTRAVGLCNVRLGQLERARAIVDIAAVQLAIGPLDEDAVRSGVVHRCFELGIDVLAHSPLGGPKRFAKLVGHDDLVWLGDAHDTTSATVALAWLYGLGLVPVPGARRPETARLAGAAARLTLRDDETAMLDEAFPLGRLVRRPPNARRPASTRGEVVVFVGIPAAGKTEHAASLTKGGFLRLSRDERGGTLKDLARGLADELDEGADRVLMDATYPTRAARSRVIEAAWDAGASVRCLWLDTPLHEAQINAVDRMLAREGRLLMPDELREAGRRDPNLFPPMAQLRFRDAFEPPMEDEGFSRIVRLPFERRALEGHDAAGVAIDLEALVDVARFPGATPFEGKLRSLEGRDVPMLVLGWLPKVGAGRENDAAVRAAFEPIGKRLGATLAYCPHEAGPPKCWCRKPLPGLLIAWMREHDIAPGKLTYMGTSSASERLAANVGALYVPA